MKRQAYKGESGEVESTFEWYGDWADVESIVTGYVPTAKTSGIGSKTSDEVLVIGCGNSSTSEEMFNQGYRRITSIDFSDIVIHEMQAKTKHLAEDTTRAHKDSWLRFQKMDMLNMSFEDNSFNMVFDKGALDALMSDETKRSSQDAAQMFREVDRVIDTSKPGGAYICVTLAQKHIMAALFRHFASPNSGWTLHIHGYSTKIGSALCPFVFVAVRSEVGGVSSILTHFGDSTSTSFGGEGEEATMGQAIRRVIAMQQTHNFLGGPIKPGCRITLHLWPQREAAQASLSKSTVVSTKGAKFSVTVIDPEYDKDSSRKTKPPNGVHSCGVFIVPRGREHEFLFSQVEGQENLALQAGYARFIIVALERGHDFSGGFESVKLELNSYMTKLAPPTSQSQKIPYLTLGGPDKLGSRIEVFSGVSQLSGPYTVEDVILDAGMEDERAVRRLVFLDNPNTVQSEVSLLNAEKSRASKKKKKKSKKKSKKARTKSTPVTKSDTQGETNTNDQEIDNGMKIIHNGLAFEFHSAMACSLGLLNASALQKRSGEIKVLVVGLGGGSLPMFIHDHFENARLATVELDPEIVSIAKRCFGFKASSGRMDVHIGDGIEFVAANATLPGAENSFDIVIFDVDAKDGLSTGVSFPPAAFLEDEFVRTVHRDVLSDDGILCINVASRSEKMFETTVQRLGSIFSVIDIARYEDSLNRIIFAHKAQALDERDMSLPSSKSDETERPAPSPLTPEAVLRRLKARSTKPWPEATDEDLIEAMRDVVSRAFRGK